MKRRRRLLCYYGWALCRKRANNVEGKKGQGKKKMCVCNTICPIGLVYLASVKTSQGVSHWKGLHKAHLAPESKTAVQARGTRILGTSLAPGLSLSKRLHLLFEPSNRGRHVPKTHITSFMAVSLNPKSFKGGNLSLTGTIEPPKLMTS